jgi:hypothetical protein
MVSGFVSLSSLLLTRCGSEFLKIQIRLWMAETMNRYVEKILESTAAHKHADRVNE